LSVSGFSFDRLKPNLGIEGFRNLGIECLSSTSSINSPNTHSAIENHAIQYPKSKIVSHPQIRNPQSKIQSAKKKGGQESKIFN
jgi:hypothetical protein